MSAFLPLNHEKNLARTSETKTVDLHKSGSTLRAISKQLKLPRASVQSIVCKLGVQLTPKTSTTTGLVKELETSGTKVCTSTIRIVLHQRERSLYAKTGMKKPDCSLQVIPSL